MDWRQQPKRLLVILALPLLIGLLFLYQASSTQRVSSRFLGWSETKGLQHGYATSGSGSPSLSCLSRDSQHLYSHKKLDPPSQELSRSWENYLRLHAACTGEKNWTQVLSGDHQDHQCRYLIYIEHGEGLGNRILSLVTAFVYALLTDRVLMIDSRKTLSSVLCEPFGTSSWLLPKDFPYQVVENGPPLGSAIDKGFVGFENLVHLRLHHVQGGGDMSFFCDEYQEPLEKVKLIAWSSNQYYVTSLFTVPWFWKKLVPLFPGPRLDVFQQLGKLVVSPANDVWRILSRFYAGYLSCSSRLIGVQIRPHGRPNINGFDGTVNDAVQDCLMEQHLLPRVAKHQRANASSSWQQLHDSRVTVLVTALQGKYYESLRDLYLVGDDVPKQDEEDDDNSSQSSPVAVHSLSHEGFEQHSLHQDQLALAEMWLLSLADEVLASSYSTFGYVGHGLSGVRPFYLDFQSSSRCFLSRSSQPCTHNPQRPSCLSSRNLTVKHREWLRKHVQQCQDHRVGIQLVD